MRINLVFVVLVGVFLFGCGGGTQISPSPASPGVVNAQTPSFTFVQVDMNLLPPDLPVWGLRGDNTEDSVKQMVFCDSEGGAPYGSSNVGLKTLSRLAGPVTIVIRDGDFSNEQVAIIESVARYMEAITGFQMLVDTKLMLGSKITLVIDPTITPPGQIAIGSPRAGGPIFEADISIKVVDSSFEYILRHEFGHLIGLCHHNKPGLMGIRVVGTDRGFFPAELDNAYLMYKLPITTPFPGERNSRSSSLSSGLVSSQKTLILD